MFRSSKIVVLVLCLLAAACQQAAPKTAAPAPKQLDKSILALTDPCAVRLDDITGALLMYYSQHHQLPTKLEDLRAAGVADATLAFTCPISGLPYVYAPENLERLGPDRRPIVYDPAPSHDGHRWVVVAAPVRPGLPVNMWVVSLDEAAFRQLLGAPAH
jgi:hypothetical protein